MNGSGKYIELWQKELKSIKKKLIASQQNQSIQLSSDEFNRAGNRQNYAFNLEFKDGVVNNNIGGSAVARDLANVLEGSSEIREILRKGHFKLNMDKQFCLWINRLA